jgi:hypothetical protein
MLGGVIPVQLIHEFDVWVTLDTALVFGERVFAGIADGRVSGERLNGAFLSGGGDWNRVLPDGWCDLDVRAHIQTDDDARIYMTYTGPLELSGVFTAAASAQAATAYSDQYLRTAVRFETGDKRYQWLTRSLFVAEGRARSGGGVEYAVSRVA